MALPPEPNLQDHLFKASDHIAEARMMLGNSLNLAVARKARGVSNEVLREVFGHITSAFMHLEEFEKAATKDMTTPKGKPYLIYRDLFDDLGKLMKKG